MSETEEQIDPLLQEILYCFSQIFENIGKQYELDDIAVLFHEDLYIEMFKIMFPFLDEKIMEIQQSKSSSAVKLQSLIDLLQSKDILRMDLSHIKGDAIANGDQKHLLNYLQIIYELSKLYKMRNENENEEQQLQIRSTPVSRHSEGNDSDQRPHSVLAIQDEFAGKHDQEGVYDQNKIGQEGEQDFEDEDLQIDPNQINIDQQQHLQQKQRQNFYQNDDEVEQEEEDPDFDYQQDQNDEGEEGEDANQYYQHEQQLFNKDSNNSSQNKKLGADPLKNQQQALKGSNPQSEEKQLLQDKNQPNKQSKYNQYLNEDDIIDQQKQNNKNNKNQLGQQKQPKDELQKRRYSDQDNNRDKQKFQQQYENEDDYDDGQQHAQDGQEFDENDGQINLFDLLDEEDLQNLEIDEDGNPQFDPNNEKHRKILEKLQMHMQQMEEQEQIQQDEEDVEQQQDQDQDEDGQGYQKEPQYNIIQEQGRSSSDISHDENRQNNQYSSQKEKQNQKIDKSDHNTKNSEIKKQNQGKDKNNISNSQRSSQKSEQKQSSESRNPHNASNPPNNNQNRKLPRTKSKKDLVDENQVAPMANKKTQKKQIEQEIFNKPNNNSRVLEKDQFKKKKNQNNNNNKKKQKVTKQPQQNNYMNPQDENEQDQDSDQVDQNLQQQHLLNEQLLQQQQQEQEQYDQQNQEEYAEDDINDYIDEEDIEKIRQLEELIQKGDIAYDDPNVIEFMNQIEQKKILKMQQLNQVRNQQQMQDINGLKMDHILAEQIQNVKQGLSSMKQQILPEDERETQEKLQKQKNQYKTFLKDYLKDYNMNQKKANRYSQGNTKNFQKKMKIVVNQGKQLQQEYDNEQKALYYKLRDEKINYLRKIHRIIFELEKRKIIDEKNQYKQSRKQRNEDTRNVLESIENAYKDRIVMLKDNLKGKRKERQIASVAQKEMVSRVERELKQEKKRQIDEVRDLWRQEKQKFDQFIKDDGVLEQKIMELYKKY